MDSGRSSNPGKRPPGMERSIPGPFHLRCCQLWQSAFFVFLTIGTFSSFRGQGEGITITITITNGPVDRVGWKIGVPALQLCHSGAGVKDINKASVVGKGNNKQTTAQSAQAATTRPVATSSEFVVNTVAHMSSYKMLFLGKRLVSEWPRAI